jgi:Phage P22-like portal protein
MKSLKKTTRALLGRAAHHHIIYLNDETGVGLSSVTMGHAHDVVLQPPTPAQLDEMGNVIVPESPGGWIILPTLDGHSHEIEDYIIKPSKKKEDDAQVLADVRELFRTGRELEKTSLLKAKEAEDLYSGKHWDEAEKARLEELQRAAVTINKIEKQVDTICGIQRSERTDIKYTPTSEGDSRVADLLNITSKHILGRCYFPREESATFEDAVIAGRGLFNVYVKFDNDLRGDIVVEKFPYLDVVFGPHEKIDLSDCEYLIKHRWFSKAKIEQLWPDKIEDIQKDFQDFILEPPAVSYPGDDYAHAVGRPIQTIGEDSMIDIAKKEYRILECWRKVYTTSSVIANPTDDFYFNAYGWEPKDVKAAGTIPGVVLIEQNITKFRITKVAGGVVLSDEYPANLPTDDFFIIPVYAKKRGAEFWGKIEGSKDAQKYINKNYSVALDVLNKTASYGWFVDSGTFPDNEKEKFKRISSSPGFVVEVNDTSRLPARVEGVKFPSELIQMMQVGEQQVLDQMNVTINPNGANESGSLFAQRRNQKLLGSEYLFDNLSFAKQKLGRLLIKLIQKYYTPERIVRIVRNASTKEQIQLGGQAVEDFSDQEIVQMLQTTDLEHYDVEVTESNWSPSMRLATFALLTELAQAGQPIPPEAILQFADMPTDVRQKIMDQMAQQGQAQAQAEQAKADAEIQKTLIAQGQIPPEVAQKFLQAPSQQTLPQNEPNQGPGIM